MLEHTITARLPSNPRHVLGCLASTATQALLCRPAFWLRVPPTDLFPGGRFPVRARYRRVLPTGAWVFTVDALSEAATLGEESELMLRALEGPVPNLTIRTVLVGDRSVSTIAETLTGEPRGPVAAFLLGRLAAQRERRYPLLFSGSLPPGAQLAH